MARQRFSDEDDDRDDRPRDDRPRDRDEDEDRPRPRRQRDDDEYDDRRGPLAKPGLATAAGVVWCVTGGIMAILSILALIGLFALAGRGGGAGGLTPANLLGLFLFFAVTVFCLIAAIRTLTGGVSGLRGFGITSIVIFGAYMLLQCVSLLALSDVPAAARGGVMGLVIGVLLIQAVLLGVGLLMPGIFALAAAKKYELWWRATKGRSRGDY